MSQIRMVGEGNKTQLWVDGKMIGHDVISYTLTQDGGCTPVLDVVMRYRVSELDVSIDDALVRTEDEQ